MLLQISDVRNALGVSSSDISDSELDRLIVEAHQVLRDNLAFKYREKISLSEGKAELSFFVFDSDWDGSVSADEVTLYAVDLDNNTKTEVVVDSLLILNGKQYILVSDDNLPDDYDYLEVEYYACESDSYLNMQNVAKEALLSWIRLQIYLRFYGLYPEWISMGNLRIRRRGDISALREDFYHLINLLRGALLSTIKEDEKNVTDTSLST